MTADMSAAADKAADKAEEVGDSAPVEVLARMGLIAYGVVYILVGWSALAIAWAGSRDPADTSGAMKTLAEQPFGQILLGLVAIGLFALALWQITQSIWGYRDREGLKRTRKQISSAGKAAVYAALGFSAASAALGGGGGGGSGGSQQQQEKTSGVLSWPGGQTIVVIAGLVIIGVGISAIRRGVTKSFLKEINLGAVPAGTSSALTRLGQIGHIAKGVALGAVGAVLAYAAWTFDPAKSRGLDGALRKILEQPFGDLALSAVAVGLMAFGLFAIVQSRYRRM
ncbi:MAG TPA: DUF1206 domain-containing protein [Sporichthya sp.]|nr:DUF1206 domain-containing protein [Sporichthya sp.]